MDGEDLHIDMTTNSLMLSISSRTFQIYTYTIIEKVLISILLISLVAVILILIFSL